MSDKAAGLAANTVNNYKKHSSITDILISSLIYTLYTLFALICIFPFYSIIINTISANDLSARGDIVFYPQQIHFQNYLDVFKIPGLWNAAVVSLGRTLIGTSLTVGASAFWDSCFLRRICGVESSGTASQ